MKDQQLTSSKALTDQQIKMETQKDEKRHRIFTDSGELLAYGKNNADKILILDGRMVFFKQVVRISCFMKILTFAIIVKKNMV